MENGLITVIRNDLIGLYSIEISDKYKIVIKINDKKRKSLVLINSYIPHTNAKEQELDRLLRKFKSQYDAIGVDD